MTIPESVNAIGAAAFGDCPNLTLRGEAGSFIEKYASAHGIPFEAL